MKFILKQILDFCNAPVQSVLLKELFVSTLLDEPAALKHQYLIGTAERGYPVGDDEGRAVLLSSLKRIANSCVGFGIDGTH